MKRQEAIQKIEELLEEYKEAKSNKREYDVPYIQGKLHATISILVEMDVLTHSDDMIFSKTMREIIRKY